jgi:hypothetical protein
MDAIERFYNKSTADKRKEQKKRAVDTALLNPLSFMKTTTCFFNMM